MEWREKSAGNRLNPFRFVECGGQSQWYLNCRVPYTAVFLDIGMDTWCSNSHSWKIHYDQTWLPELESQFLGFVGTK